MLNAIKQGLVGACSRCCFACSYAACSCSTRLTSTVTCGGLKLNQTDAHSLDECTHVQDALLAVDPLLACRRVPLHQLFRLLSMDDSSFKYVSQKRKGQRDLCAFVFLLGPKIPRNRGEKEQAAQHKIHDLLHGTDGLVQHAAEHHAV